MKETDILKLAEKISSKMALKELLKIQNISNIFLTPNVLQNLKSIYGNLKEEERKKIDNIKKLDELVCNSLEYENLIKLNQIYINAIVEYLQELELKNTYEIVLYYENLLFNGYLSKDMVFNYHNFINDPYTRWWVCNSRIVSGTVYVDILLYYSIIFYIK